MTALESQPKLVRPKKLEVNPYPWYSPRFWHGMRPGTWWSLLIEHRFRIHPIRWAMAVLVSLITPMNSLLGAVQQFWFGRRIRATAITQAPVFIIGHWRSGTTFLHELLNLDERFATPTTYQCFAPHHFVVSEWFIARFLGFLMPKQRPMDNMAAGWYRPQEDEFALLTLGAPTPYLRMAFPNDGPVHGEFLDMQGCAAGDLRRFEEKLLHFVRLLTFATGKQVLLKSPPHTGRVETLARLFPGAKFIHIVRDPFALFPSTMRLWQSLDEVQSLQVPRGEDREEYVFGCLERMYRGFENQRQRLNPDTIIDVRYEDLVANPEGKLGEIYERLALGDYANVRDKVAAFVGEQKDYQTNKHELDESLKSRIRERWADYFARYGYA
jgi:omega-hydroxy-beta-dihydromenaquinone-9 sulfotransferase